MLVVQESTKGVGATLMEVSVLLSEVNQTIYAYTLAKRLYFRRLAPDFNIFAFIEPDELKLSGIIKWLLDPHESHGQGSRFLTLLARKLGREEPVSVWAKAEVRAEVPIRDGRLDILVKTSTIQLEIENKPWAEDLDEQLTRYFQYFDKVDSKVLIVYLTKSGTEPSLNSLRTEQLDQRLSSGQLKLWGYNREILDWLTECRTECRADRVSMFIDEFSHYVDATFAGAQDRTMTDQIVDEIVGSSQNVLAAMQIISLSDDIRRRLFLKLRQQLEQRLLGHKVDVDSEPWKKYSYIDIAFSDRSPYTFCMEFENTQFNGLVTGVARKVKGNLESGDEYNALVKSFGNGSKNDDWLWYCFASPTNPFLPIERHWQDTAEPWVNIANGKLSTSIAEAFERCFRV